MTKLRVLFFCPVAYFKGGAERSLMDLIANPAIDPQVVVPAAGPISEEMVSRGINVHIVPLRGIEDVHRPFTFAIGIGAFKDMINAARSLLRISRAQRIDVLHCNGLKAHVVGVATRIIGGPPVVVHIRDIPFTHAERIVWQMLRFTADRLILVSRACWPGRKIPNNTVVIHNGIDIPDGELGPFRPGKPLNLGFIGRIDPAKGLHLLLGWISQAIHAGLDLTLTVRGRFDSTDPEYERQIGALISELGLEKRVTFEGFVADIDKVYADINAICVPSHVPDPLPRSVMEPMALGIPVLGYPAGGIPEMINHLETGYLVSNGEQFVRSVRSLQSDITAVTAITLAARHKMQADFSIPVLYSKLNALYQELAKR